MMVVDKKLEYFNGSDYRNKTGITFASTENVLERNLFICRCCLFPPPTYAKGEEGTNEFRSNTGRLLNGNLVFLRMTDLKNHIASPTCYGYMGISKGGITLLGHEYFKWKLSLTSFTFTKITIFPPPNTSSMLGKNKKGETPIYRISNDTAKELNEMTHNLDIMEFLVKYDDFYGKAKLDNHRTAYRKLFEYKIFESVMEYNKDAIVSSFYFYYIFCLMNSLINCCLNTNRRRNQRQRLLKFK